MNNMSTKTLMTVEQFARMHTADTEDYELVEGELIPLSSGTPSMPKSGVEWNAWLRIILRRIQSARCLVK
jgi:hypothetical protein